MEAPYNLIFGISAVLFNLLIAYIFIASKSNKMQVVRKIGTGLLMLGLPFGFLFYRSVTVAANTTVAIALAVVLSYLMVELLLDFILKVDFRTRFITHFPYILLEYGAFISLIYTAFEVSSGWGWAVSITFWIAMAALIYYLAGNRKSKET